MKVKVDVVYGLDVQDIVPFHWRLGRYRSRLRIGAQILNRFSWANWSHWAHVRATQQRTGCSQQVNKRTCNCTACLRAPNMSSNATNESSARDWPSESLRLWASKQLFLFPILDWTRRRWKRFSIRLQWASICTWSGRARERHWSSYSWNALTFNPVPFGEQLIGHWFACRRTLTTMICKISFIERTEEEQCNKQINNIAVELLLADDYTFYWRADDCGPPNMDSVTWAPAKTSTFITSREIWVTFFVKRRWMKRFRNYFWSDLTMRNDWRGVYVNGRNAANGRSKSWICYFNFE